MRSIEQVDRIVDSRSWVYQCYCAHGEMLYVGVTFNLERRLEEHRRKEWWHHVGWIQSDLYASREQAFDVEAFYIRTYRPQYNIAGKPEHPMPPHPLIRRRDYQVDGDGALLLTLNDRSDHVPMQA